MLNLEWYLTDVTIPEYRYAISRFRCVSHNLSIESGRHSNIPRAERLCVYCQIHGNSKIETEYHIIIDCNLYHHLWLKYLPDCY